MKRDVDLVIERLLAEYPAIRVEQLKVMFPVADDDGLWFFRNPDSRFEVQIESPYGMCPFLIETDEHDERVESDSVESVLDTLKKWLHVW
jgi:hypothetical protein